MNNPDKFLQIQRKIIDGLEAADGKKLTWTEWQRKPDEDCGGGKSAALYDGNIFESCGVNFSEVYGKMPCHFANLLLKQYANGQPEAVSTTELSKDEDFHATGVSLVIHPLNPHVPTVHFNVRAIRLGELSWFGGGMDLTPHLLYEEDAQNFHATIKATCDQFDTNYYPKFKAWCDEYFYLKHRKESRGIGGLFFDYLKSSDATESFTFAIANTFLECYLPIVEQRRNTDWTDPEREWQLYRRGRYVEFNLLYDRGTKFGLETDGRVESILMSLPPLARWKSGDIEPPTQRAQELLKWLRR